MPKKCIICKIGPSPAFKRSFHKFPSNSLIRLKWLEALNLENCLNFKTAYICSDHFDEDSFFYSDESRQRKRLGRDAIPQKKNFNSFCKTRKNVTDKSATTSINSCELIDIRKDASVETNTDRVTKMCTEEMPLKHFLDTDPVSCKTKTVNNNTSSNISNNKNRKCSFTNTKRIKRLRFVTNKTEYICREDFVSEEAWKRFLRYAAYRRSKIAAAYKRINK